jgi:hypothetical protein
MLSRIVSLFACLVMAACSAGGESFNAPVVVDAPGTLSVRVDPDGAPAVYAEWLPIAAARLTAASGMTLRVTEDQGIPLTVVEQHDPNWYGGLHSFVLALDLETIATSACEGGGPSILLHEILHGFGSGHVKESRGGGLMKAHLSGCEPLTTADLTEVCDSADCLWFTPED